MAEFLPRQGPVYEDTNLRNLVKWVESEFQKLARSQQEAGLVPMQELHVAVDKPREGMIIRADGTNWNPGQGKGTYERVNGVWRKMHGFPADGDYGDITIGGTGTTLTIDNDAVTNAKLANMAATRVKARGTASTGDPEDIAIGNGITLDATSLRTLQQMSVTVDGSGLKLDGDSGTPGNSKYYGTNASGTKGFNSVPQLQFLGEDGVGTGTTFTKTISPTSKFIVVFLSNVSHNNGAAQNLRVELSGDGGVSGWGGPITLTQATFGAASAIAGMFCIGTNTNTTSYIGSQISGNTNGAVTVPGMSGGTGPDSYRLSWSAGNFDSGTALTLVVQ